MENDFVECQQLHSHTESINTGMIQKEKKSGTDLSDNLRSQRSKPGVSNHCVAIFSVEESERLTKSLLHTITRTLFPSISLEW